MTRKYPKKHKLRGTSEHGEESMYCPRCKRKMKIVKRKGGFHKKTKWVCPECGLVRMQENKPK